MLKTGCMSVGLDFIVLAIFANFMSQLTYWEQQWVRCSRLLLGVAPRRRRGGMRRRRRSLTCGRSSLRHTLSLYGTPRVCEETLEVQSVESGAEEVAGE